MNKQSFAEWIEGKYLAWRASQGRRASLTQYAAHLKVSRNNLNNWMLKGVIPEGENLLRLASVYGAEVFEVLGQKPLDPTVQELLAIFGRLPPQKQKTALNWMRKFAGLAFIAKSPKKEHSDAA